MSFQNPESPQNSFPSNLEKIAIVVAVIPFLFYNWSGLPSATIVEGIKHFWPFAGGIVALLMIPLIFIKELRTVPKEEKMKHILILLPIDFMGIIHLLYGLGIFES